MKTLLQTGSTRFRRLFGIGGAVLLIGAASGFAAVRLVDASSPAVPSVFVPLSPQRILDTRSGLGGSTMHGGSILTLPIVGVAGVAPGATAVQLNVTVVNGTQTSYLTVWPSTDTMPTASSLNWSDAAAHPNAVTATIGTDGAVKLYNFAGSVDVIADVAGYYVPGSGATGPAGPAGPAGPTGPAGSARAWVMIAPNGSIARSSPGVTWTVTRLSAGFYCIQTTPNVLSNYGPVLATLHGPDTTPGSVNVNQEFGSNCNPYGGYSVSTTNLAGTPTDRYVLVAAL